MVFLVLVFLSLFYLLCFKTPLEKELKMKSEKKKRKGGRTPAKPLPSFPHGPKPPPRPRSRAAQLAWQRAPPSLPSLADSWGRSLLSLPSGTHQSGVFPYLLPRASPGRISFPRPTQSQFARDFLAKSEPSLYKTPKPFPVLPSFPYIEAMRPYPPLNFAFGSRRETESAAVVAPCNTWQFHRNQVLVELRSRSAKPPNPSLRFLSLYLVF